jgi:LPS O-antigen subunit length determinant protein (WzzB/FepE family)
MNTLFDFYMLIIVVPIVFAVIAVKYALIRRKK